MDSIKLCHSLKSKGGKRKQCISLFLTCLIYAPVANWEILSNILTCAGLADDFLFNRWKERNGILQHFVEPKGTRNGRFSHDMFSRESHTDVGCHRSELASEKG